MCLCCVCCCSCKSCSLVCAIYTAIEAFCFLCFNLALILTYECTIDPPQKESLGPGAEFVEKAWSWFFYDEDKCIAKYGASYQPPTWITDPPLYTYLSGVVYKVTPTANYGYQITFFILNFLWFISVVPLIYGILRKQHNLMLPWICLTAISSSLDTIIGAFYIKLMDDTSLTWDDSQAIFAMQFLYFRGFILYILNIVALVFVAANFWKVYMKRRKQRKFHKKLTTNMLVHPTVEYNPQQEMHSSQTYDLIYDPPHPHGPQESHAISETHFDYQQQRKPAPIKYRPFSYTNPAFRPADPFDVEGMRYHAPGPHTSQGYQNQALYVVGSSGDISTYDRPIPRVSLQKR